MKHKHFTRWVSVLLVMATLFGLLSFPASAVDSDLSGSGTVTIKLDANNSFLSKTSGGTYNGGSWTYTSNTGVTGPAYCVNYGLKAVSESKALSIKEFNKNPQTMGAFANGYPQRTLAQFKEIHADDIRGIANLTEVEYGYATQVAVWATCGQIKVEGTSFTAGKSTLEVPTADAQKIRIYDSVVAILKLASYWTKHLYSGMSIRAEEDQDIRGVEIIDENGLEGAAASGANGMKKETISGREYYSRVMYVSSASSTYIDGYKTKVFSTDAPTGTIFVAENNSPLETETTGSVTYYKVDTSQSRTTNLNSNGQEYYGAFKVCIPVDAAADEGSFTVKATGGVAQFKLYLANNPASSEQSYIIADPAYTVLDAQAPFSWKRTTTTDETAKLQIVKTGEGGSPLEGAEFTLTGDKGTVVTGTSNRNGQVIWTDLPAGEKFTLTETTAPEGYQIMAPMNITLSPGRTTYVTVPNSTEKGFTIKKIDSQNKASLQGAVFRFEQIDGDFITTGTTGHDGTISFEGDDLPYGSYRITEQSSPEGYVKSSRVETIEWTGEQDITITWENDRDIGLRIVKVDEQTGASLSGATFDVYADGELFTSVTTDDSGEAHVTGIRKEAYIEVVETASPAGYVLDPTPHGIHIDPYDPTIEADPVLTVTNRARPSLRIIKYDQTTKRHLPDVTFEVYHDSELFGEYTTNGDGEIFLTDLEPGTYLVKEVASDADHVVNSTPQQIEVKAGATQTYELVFMNSLKPGLHLIKVDSVTMKSLPNVRFEFKKVGGSYKQEFTTDINGEIDLSRLEPGAYEVRELEAPEGYLIDDAVRIIQLNPDETASFVFTNTPKPTFKLIKVSSDGTPLAGVHFRIARIEDGTRYLDRITNERGEIVIDKLEPGVYSVKETATVSDHVLDLLEYHVELFPGKTSTIVIENQKRPNLIVMKRDADTGEPVPNTIFIVRAADGHSVDEIRTDATGKATLNNLLPGVYEISEKSVPSDYLLDAPSQLVTLYANRDHTVYFENHKKPSLTIMKVDAASGDVIRGATFHIWYGSNNTNTGELNDLGLHETDFDGLVTLTGLRDGWYKVQETEAAAGYVIKDTGEQTVYIKGGENKQLIFENIPLSAIVIWKFDSVTGTAISGASFTVRYLGGESGTGGTAIGTYKTGTNGAVTVTGLKPGTYVVEEISSDPDHVIDTAPQTVVLTGQTQDVVQVYFGNTPKGSVLVRKIDAITHQPLAGVEFAVTDSKGTVIGSNNGKYVTDSSGSFIVEDLEPGVTLVVTETKAKDGYILDETPQTVMVKPGKTVTLEFTNKSKGSLLIRKVCSVNPSIALQDAEFKAVYSDGSVVGNANGIFRTNESGEILITGLVPGKSVVVTETRAPDGFIMDSQSQTILIKDDGVPAVLTFKNQPKGGIVLQKRDSETGKPLAGAQFRLTTAAGCEVGLDGVIGTSTATSNGIFTTDAAGEIKISNLAPGAYIWTELLAPEGYVIDQASGTVVVGANGDVQTVVVTNSKAGSLIIEKRDSVTNEPLQGVTFKVTTATGEFVPDANGHISSNGLYYTDANGLIQINGVVGTLVVTEERTIEGYVIDESTRTQTVTVHPNDTQHLLFYNVPKNTLVVQKYATDTMEPLPGVKYSVTTSDGAAVGNSNGVFFTDQNGQVIVNGLTPGITLVVREIETVAGYTLETVPQTILVREGEPLSLIFGNKPLANLTILKKDPQGRPLANAQFLVTDQKGLPIGPYGGHYTTASNGQVTITGIQPDVQITVREEVAPAGYVLNTEPQSIVVKSNEDNQLTFVNGQKGTLVIIKVDSETDTPLAGAEFKITTADGKLVGNLEGTVTSNGIYTTDKTGSITISGLEPGAFVVTEVKAPAGYVLDSAPVTVQVDANDTQTIKIRNTPLNGIIIQKFEGDTTIPVVGAVFLVTDDSGAPIGTTEGEFVTDSNGRIVITGLTPGMSVTAKEIRVPDEYVLDSTPKTVKVTEGASQTLTFRNEKKVSLTINKHKDGTMEPLAGVTFKVTVSDGTVLGNNGLFMTNAQGQIVIPNLTPGTVVTAQEVDTVDGYELDPFPQSITIQKAAGGQTAGVTGNGQSLSFGNKPLANLTILKLDRLTREPLAGAKFFVTGKDGAPLGTNGGYEVTGENGMVIISGIRPDTAVTVREEQAPSGYALNPNPQTITVQSDKDNKLTFENDPLCNLTIRKVDSLSGKGLAGAQFLATNQDGSPVGASDGHFTTGSNGSVTITGLMPGAAITVREEKAPAGYTLNQEPQTIVLKAGEDNTLTFEDAAKGTLIILKLDSKTNLPIPGVEFKITTSDGKLVGNLEGTVTSNGMYITDQNGEIRLTGLSPAAYIITETRAADGYLLNTMPTTVEVTTNDTQTVRLYNDPTQTLTIRKFVDGTTNPIAGVTFLIKDSDGKLLGPSNGEYVTDKNGRIVLEGLTPGTTIIAQETKGVSGYVLDTTPQSIKIKAGEAQFLTFYNKVEGGLELIKVNADDKSKRIPNTTFEVRKMDGALVETITTDRDGRVHVALDAGDYYLVETEAAEGYKIDSTPIYFTIEDGKTTTKTVTNKAFSGIIIHKIDSVTGAGIYDVKFLLYDQNKNPIGEYSTDSDGYIYIDEAIAEGKGRFYLRELQAAPGYELDKEYKTVYVQPGKTIEIEWENVPITGQIQVIKYAAEYNEVTGTPAGATLQGAVYEISDPRTNKVVDYITTDAHGIAASKPLPLGRYKIVEVTAPAYWQIDPTVHDVTLEYSGQIIKVSAYDKPSNLGVVITKRGNAEVLAGSSMRYDFTVANTSNVALENYYWHDRIPTDAARATVLTTGTYSARLNYRILYKTNYSGVYQVLASNLLTTSTYSFSLNAIPTQAGEVVTDIYFDFGKVPVGFQSVVNPTLTVVASGTAANGYQLINRADVGGKYQGTWQTAQASWVTIIRRLTPVTPLPKTGY